MADDPSVDELFLALAHGIEQNLFFFSLLRISCLPQCSHATISVGNGVDVDDVTFGVDVPLDSPLTFAESAFASSALAFSDGSSFSFSEYRCRVTGNGLSDSCMTNPSIMCVSTFGFTIAFGTSFFNIDKLPFVVFFDSASPFCTASGELTAGVFVVEFGVLGEPAGVLTGEVVETDSSFFSSVACFLASFDFDSSADLFIGDDRALLLSPVDASDFSFGVLIPDIGDAERVFIAIKGFCGG